MRVVGHRWWRRIATSLPLSTLSPWLNISGLQGLSLLLGLAGTLAIAAVLSPDDYGRLTIVVATVSVLNAFLAIQFGALPIEVRRQSRTDQESRATTHWLLKADVLFACTSAVLILLALSFAQDRLPGVPRELVSWMMLQTIVVAVTGGAATARGFLVLAAQTRKVQLSDVASRVARLVACPALGWRLGVSGVILGFIIEQSVSTGLTLNYYHLLTSTTLREVGLSRRPAMWRPLARVGLHMWGATTIKSVYAQLDVLLLGAAYGPYLTGLYGFAKTLVGYLSVIVIPINLITTPMFATWEIANERARMVRYAGRLTLVLLGMLVTGSVVAWIAYPYVLSLVGLHRYVPAHLLILVLLPGMILSVATSWRQSFLLATGHSQWFLISSIVTASLIIPGYFFALKFAAVGIALVSGLVPSLEAVIWLLIFKRLIRTQTRYTAHAGNPRAPDFIEV